MNGANPWHRLQRVLLLVGCLMVLGTLGYRHLCGLSWLDALYFTVITMSTVGYREVGDLTPAGKLFTIALIFAGAGVLAYSVSATLEVLVDEPYRWYFSHMFARRRSRHMKDHHIVCGFGRVGRSVCQELSAAKMPFIVIDSSPDRAKQAERLGYVAIHGDASDDRVLQDANIECAQGLVCTINTDAGNLFVLISARALNGNLQISARVNDDNNVKKFHAAGATHVYSPFSLLGRRIARSITRPRVLELLDVALEQNNYAVTIEEFTVSERSPLAWLSLKDSGIRQNFGGAVISVIRHDREIVHNPEPDMVCQPGDILITLGLPDQLARLRAVVELKN